MNEIIVSEILTRLGDIEKRLAREEVLESPILASVITGSGISGQLTLWNGITSVTGSAAFTYVDNQYIELSISSTANPRGLVVTETGGVGAQVWIRRNSGSAVTSGQTIGVYVFDGWDGSAYSFLNGGSSIAAVAGENWSGTQRGTLLSLRSTKNGTTTLAERFRIGSDGNILMTNDPDLSAVFNANSAGGIGQFIFVQNSVNQWFMRMNATADFDWVDTGGNQVIFLQQTNRNIGLGGANSFGANAVSVISIIIGTAPTSSPANLAQIWVADANGTANRAWPYMRPEDGTDRVIMGISGDSGVSTGTGTVLMNGTTNRNSVGWITTHDINGNTIFIPYWTTITG